jgi:hypothetical protein
LQASVSAFSPGLHANPRAAGAQGLPGYTASRAMQLIDVLAQEAAATQDTVQATSVLMRQGEI